ncbi:MAG: glycosyl hydrolase 53 family protein [Sedimentisphaerales bacterium]|nr:glycosyl hydrolase 53 family protein [Sedimentisphaerales bacterium]
MKTSSILACIIIFPAACRCSAEPNRPGSFDEFIIGADVSWLQQHEDRGRKFYDHGIQKDLLQILKDHGFNWIRLRIFNNPAAPNGYSKQGYCDLEHTIKMAKRIKAAKMKFLLDFHYSDTWADPAHQRKPADWNDLPFEQLIAALHEYTKNVITELGKNDVVPEMVQIGNEISSGFLWPDGSLDDFEKFAGLIKAGVSAVRIADPNAKIMLHIACGGQNEKSKWFMDSVIKCGIGFDILGQSYYPKWHGTPEDLRKNLTDLSRRYSRPIIVVEYSQHKALVNQIVRDLPNGKGLGAFIWEPTTWGEPIFDKKGNTLSLIDIYPKIAQTPALLP